ncbi:MAG: sensor histidine kinase, partial [Gemmatimonadaceae bacterium]
VRTFRLEDDGSGKREPDGNGITGMRERVRSLGGDISIESFPGTRIRVTLAPRAERRDDSPPSSPAKLAILA